MEIDQYSWLKNNVTFKQFGQIVSVINYLMQSVYFLPPLNIAESSFSPSEDLCACTENLLFESACDAFLCVCVLSTMLVNIEIIKISQHIATFNISFAIFSIPVIVNAL
jgi:hypothetical protein